MKNSKKIQKKLFLISLMSVTLFSPLSLISCSNVQTNNKTIDYDQYYKKFYSSLVFKENQLYFEMFNLKEEGEEKIVGLDVVGNILSLSGFESDEIVNKFILKRENNQLKITYNLFDKNNKLIIPTNLLWNTRTISNIKSLNSTQVDLLREIKDLWVKNKSIQIFNPNTDQTLTNNKYVVASSLSKIYFSKSENDFIKSLSIDKTQLLTDLNSYIDFEYIYDDVKGIIKIGLKIVNKNNLSFSIEGDNLLTIEGFAPIEERRQDIIHIFNDQINKSYDMKSEQFKNVKIFASSIYDDVVFENFIKSNLTKEQLPDFFDDIKKNNLWYELKMIVKSSDRYGNLTVEFKIVNKFTKEEFKPSNIGTSMFFFNFFKLSNVNPNNYKEVDNSIIENIYKAYQLFENIKLNDKNKFNALPSENTDDIDWNWLKTNTNLNIINNDEFMISSKVKYSWDGFDLKERVNKFRFKKISNPSVINNDILGTKSVSFLLEMEYETSENSKEWLIVLPPNPGDLDYIGYASNVKYLNIGDFRNKNINDVSSIYEVISTLKEINIDNIPFSQLSEYQNLSAKEFVDKFENIISIRVDDKLIENNIQTLSNEYSFVLDTLESQIVKKTNDKDRIVSIEINNISYNVVPKSNKDQKQVWYKKDGDKVLVEAYPKIVLKINFS